jgi:basic membrane protein A
MKQLIIIAVGILFFSVAGIFVVSGRHIKDVTACHPVKAGMIMTGSRDSSTWNDAHLQGMQKAGQELSLSLACEDNVSADDCDKVMERMIRDGCKIIISTSIEFEDAVSRLAMRYPAVYFFQATGTHPHANVATYMGRMYQMRYLAGIIAGRKTKNRAVGYVATQPVTEVIRGIDAFALGVRRVNPTAVVYVKYTNNWGDYGQDEKTTAELLDACPQIDVLAMHVDTEGPSAVCEQRGVYTIGCNVAGDQYPKTSLTAVIWDWDIFYTKYIREALNGKFEGRNYLVGADTGIVALAPLTELVDRATVLQVEQEKKIMISGEEDVFCGPIRDREGNMRCEAGENLSDQTLFDNLDWYVEGVAFP